MSEYGGGMLRQIKPGRFRIEHPLAVNEKDGSVLVYVPAGEFEMGDGQDKDCPKHRVKLSAYWIGVYCVTNVQYLRFVEATGHRVISANLTIELIYYSSPPLGMSRSID